MRRLWVTAADLLGRVIFNEVLERESVAQAMASVQALVPVEYHGSICITDEDNNPVFDVVAVPSRNKREGAEFHKVKGRIMHTAYASDRMQHVRWRPNRRIRKQLLRDFPDQVRSARINGCAYWEVL